jgi:hypothetical protein
LFWKFRIFDKIYSNSVQYWFITCSVTKLKNSNSILSFSLETKCNKGNYWYIYISQHQQITTGTYCISLCLSVATSFFFFSRLIMLFVFERNKIVSNCDHRSISFWIHIYDKWLKLNHIAINSQKQLRKS